MPFPAAMLWFVRLQDLLKWDQAMRLLISKGVQIFVEVGPGKVLCGLMRQIDRSKICLNVGDEASLQKTLEHFAETKA